MTDEGVNQAPGPLSEAPGPSEHPVEGRGAGDRSHAAEVEVGQGEETAPAPVRRGPQRLDAAFVPAAQLTGWITTGTLSLAGSLAFLVALVTIDWVALGWIAVGAAWLGFLGFLAWMSHVWPRLTYRRTIWRVDEEGIEIRRGVVWRHVVSVPRARIQHTDVAQGPIERRFGLATLVVHTAGNHEYEVRLGGLARPQALGVRDFLLGAGPGEVEASP